MSFGNINPSRMHRCLVTPKCKSKLVHHWFKWWLVAVWCQDIIWNWRVIVQSTIENIGIDRSHKSHNAPASYPTTHRWEQKCAHCCSKWCVVECGTGAFRGSWIWSISFCYTSICCQICFGFEHWSISRWMWLLIYMMTSWNGNIFRVIGHLCGKFTVHLWIPLTKASDAELSCKLALIYTWTNGWVNNLDAGDLVSHRAHYNVTLYCRWIWVILSDKCC